MNILVRMQAALPEPADLPTSAYSDNAPTPISKNRLPMQDISVDAVPEDISSVEALLIEEPAQRLAAGSHSVQLDPDDGLILRYTVAGSGPVVVAQAPGWGIGAG